MASCSGYFWPRTISEFQTGLGSHVGTLPRFPCGYFWPRTQFLSKDSRFNFHSQRVIQEPYFWKRNQVHSQAIKRLFNYFQPFTLIRKNLVGWFFCRLHGWGVFAELRLACRTFIFRWSKCDYPKTTKHQSKWQRSWTSARRQSIECANQANCLAIALEAGGESTKKQSCWWKIQTWCYSNSSKAWRRLVGRN